MSHDAGPVLGLDRIAFAGELGQLDLLDIVPVRCLDRNGEPLHSPHDRTIVSKWIGTRELTNREIEVVNAIKGRQGKLREVQGRPVCQTDRNRSSMGRTPPPR